MIRPYGSVLVAALFSVFLGACSNTVTIDYVPKTVAETKGKVVVNKFNNLKIHNADDNEIPQPFGTGVYLTETVGDYVANAVRREFKQAGITYRNAKCSLDGEIHDFSFNQWAFSTTYITNIRYILNGPSGKVLYDTNLKVEFEAAKNVSDAIFISNLNKALSDNIDKLLNDSPFVLSVEQYCR